MKSVIKAGATFSLLMACPVYADTITTRDHVSINGSLLTMANGELTIVARYRTNDKTFSIKAADVEIIEFNDSTFNSGAPPRAIGMGPRGDGKASPAQTQAAADTIFLRGSHKACKLVGIDRELVHCAGKDGDYSRKVVLRITLRMESP